MTVCGQGEKMEASRDVPGGAAADEICRYQECIRNLKECFEVSSLINSTLELDVVLERIMTASRNILKADACSLMLVDEATRELVVEVAQGPVADRLKGGFRLAKGEGIAGHVFETGEALLIENAYEDHRFHREFDRKTGYCTRSVLCVPLKIKDRIIGVFQIINKLDGTPFRPEDEEILVLLSTHAAVAIENARMHRALLRKQQIESDLAFAASVQQSFLPQEVPRIEGVSFHTHYRAAMEIGGDFYDFIPLDRGRLGILIGDVSGKGIASALFMARLTSDFRFEAIRTRAPARVVEMVNGLLCAKSRQGMFATLLFLVLDPIERKITYVNAGHPPPLLWNHRNNRRQMLRDAAGLPLGIDPGEVYPTGEIALRDGDCIVLYTDGLLEARSHAGEHFGWDRLQAAVCSGSSCADEAHNRLIEAMRAFVQDCRQVDDTTVVMFSIEEAS